MENKSAKTGMALFLMSEAMFFAGLISAYWVLRNQLQPWPPADQPRLPVLVTGINTFVLIATASALLGLGKTLQRGCLSCLVGRLGIAGLGGVVFLGVQGYEWTRMLHFGLTVTRNVYGGLFYFIIGAHALHVVAALFLLFLVLFQILRQRGWEGRVGRLTACRIYWLFVVVVWPVLYALVYF